MTIKQAKSELMQIYGALSPDKQRAIDTLVKIEPKTGHWMHDGSHWENRFICSECGYKLFDEPTNYCPNCGARMAESEVQNESID